MADARKPPVRKVRRSRGICLMVYGIPGVGKTRLVAQPGTLLLRPPSEHTDAIEVPDEVDEISFDSWSVVHDTMEWMMRGGAKDYRWVWFDSISMFQDYGMDDLFSDAVARNPHRAAFGWDKPEYGINQTRLGTFVRNMRGLADEGKLNFGVTAHAMEWYDPIEEKEKWAPLIQGGEGRFMQKVCGMMHVVAHYREAKREGERVRVLQTGGTWHDKQVLTVDHLNGIFPKDRIVNPSMKQIEEAIVAARKRRGGSKQTTRPKRRRRRRVK